jgi:hypothetical protein
MDMGSAKKNKSRSRSGLRADLGEFARLFRSVVDPYRPELHYMRGPGPKWRAKHAAPAPAETPHLPGLARIER